MIAGLRARWLLLVLAIVASSSGAQQAAKIHMHMDDGYAADGLLFEPSGVAIAPAALLLIPDDWGVTGAVLDEARGLAASGYLVVVIDLYRGRVASNAKEAAALARELSRDGALHDLRAAIAFIRQQSNVRPGRIGIVGWSSGGAHALRLAAVEAGVSAVVTIGSSSVAPSQSKGLKAHVLTLTGRDTENRMRAFLEAELSH